MSRSIVNRVIVWTMVVAVMATFTAVTAQAQANDADEASAAATEESSQAPATEGEASADAGGEFALTPTVVEAVSQRDAYGLDGFYQPGRSSFPLGGTLAAPEEVPFSFSVLDEDLLTDINPEELDSIAQFVPGVQMGNQNSNLTEVFVSRGFQLGRDNILFNGMQQADAFGVTQKELVSEIEFYRGPSSILNGKTPPGGAANIVTKKPLAETFVRLTGTFDQHPQARGALDVNLADLKAFGVDAAFRLNVAGGRADTFRDEIEQDDWLVAPVLTLNFTDRTTVTLEAHFTKIEVPDDRGLPLLGGTTDEAAERFDEDEFILGTTAEENEQETIRLMLDASHRWTDQVTTNFQISYGESERSFFGVFAGTFNPATNTLTRTHFGTEDEFKNLDTRLDTTFAFDTDLLAYEGIVGVQYRDFERRDNFTGFTPNADAVNINNPDPDLPFQGFGPGGGLQGDEESIEGFFQHAIEVTEGPLTGFRLIGGGRVTDFRNELNPDQDEMEFSPRVGVGYTPPKLDWLMIYGNYSESFDPQGDTTASGDPLPPQEGEQWEVGAKATLFDGRLTATLAWFDLENTNVGVDDPMNPGASIAVGQQENQGLELEVIGELLPGLQVFGQYTFNDSEITNDPDLNGNELALTPDHSGSVWLRYDFPEFSSPLLSGATDRVTVGGGVTYVGDRFVSAQNAIELTSYARLDLMARYALGQDTTFQLSVQNVTDERYFTGGNTFGGSVTPGQPLTFLFQATHEF